MSHVKLEHLDPFWLFYFASRALMILTPGYTHDLQEFAFWGDALLRGKNIYAEFPLDPQGTFAIKYPPLFYVACATFLFLFGYSSASLKAGLLLFEVPTIILLPKLREALETRGNWSEERRLPLHERSAWSLDGRVTRYVYAFCPVTVVAWLFGHFFAVATFFLVAGAFAYLKRRFTACGVLLAVGFMVEIFPAFFLLPVALELFARRRWRPLAFLAASFTATFVATGLPFLVVDLSGFVHNFIVHFGRVPQALSFWQPMNFFLPEIVVPGTSFTLNLLGTTFLAYVGVFSLYSYSLFRRKVNRGVEPNDLPQVTIVLATSFYLGFCLVFLSLFFRYLFWALPFACLFVRTRPGPRDEAVAEFVRHGWTFPPASSSRDCPPQRSEVLANWRLTRRLAMVTTLALVPYASATTWAWGLHAFGNLVQMEVNRLAYSFLMDSHGMFTMALSLVWVAASGSLTLRGLENKRPSFFQVLLVVNASFSAQLVLLNAMGPGQAYWLTWLVLFVPNLSIFLLQVVWFWEARIPA